MKILKITTLLDFGGQEKQYLSFTENPKLLTNQYVFVAIGHGGFTEKVLRERGFEVHILNLKVSIKNFKNIIVLYKLIKKIKPDIVHTAAAEANFFGVLAAKMARIKSIYAEEIGIPNHSSTAKYIFKQIYKLTTKVICVSNAVKSALVSYKEIKPEKGIVVYNPVSIPKQFPKNENTGFFEMVYIGRLEKVKNVCLLINVLSKLKDKKIRLTIVGDGTEKNNLTEQANNLNISNINFTGFSSEPSKYLSNADLFVLPSFSEGFGIAAVEAMFLKIPVLCSEVGGIPEFISDGENGWLFNPNSQTQLEEKISEIITLEPLSLKNIGEKGYASVINKFTIEIYCSNIEKVYKK